MDLHRLTCRLRPFWVDDIATLRTALAGLTFTATNWHQLLGLVDEETRLRHIGRALNWLTLGLIADEQKTVSHIRRSGLLRCSRYKFDPSFPKEIVTVLRHRADELRLSPGTVGYLVSLLSLYELGVCASRQRAELMRLFRRHKGTLPKNLLVVTDFFFWQELVGETPLRADEPEYYSKEDLADGFSYAFYLFDETVGVSDLSMSFAFFHSAPAEECREILRRATQLRYFREWEILVDAFGYSCAWNPRERQLLLKPGDDSLGKAIRLGYVQQEMARSLRWFDVDDPMRIPSISDVAEAMVRDLGERCIVFKEKPIRRLVCTLPVEGPLKDLIQEDQLFREEYLMLLSVTKEELIGERELLDFNVADGVTVLDLLRVRRLVNLVRLIISSKAREYRAASPDVILQSMTPTFSEEQLNSILSLAVDASKREVVKDLLIWKRERGRVFDVQYQPIVKSGTQYHIPLNIAGDSSIIRNSLQVRQVRIHDGKDKNPMEEVLSRVFGDQGRASVEYDYKGERGDVDVAALIDGVLFVFETKCSLVPCNPFELRTTLDHVTKAAEQLSRFERLFKDRGFREYLASRMRWSFGGSERVVGGIVVSNRMLTGYSVSGYPIRSLLELAGFVEEGTIRIGNKVVRTREEGPLRGRDLEEYLRFQSVHRIMFDSMVDVTRKYPFSDATATEQTCALDLVKVARGFGVDPREAFPPEAMAGPGVVEDVARRQD